MAKKTIELSKSKLNIVFRLIMGDLHKEFPDKIENATTKDKTNFEPGLIKTGSVNEICSFVSEKCGWKRTNKGGRFYWLYSELKSNRKYSKPNETISLSEEIIRGLFVYIRSRKITPIDPTIDLQAIENDLLQYFFTSRLSKKPLTSKENKETLNKYYAACTQLDFPKNWLESTWLSYERTDSGIGISTIKFENQGGTVYVKFETKYKDGNVHYDFSYRGIAFKDKGNEYIILNLFKDQGESNWASFIMRFDKYNDQSQEISVGHMSFFSIRFRRYISKVVVWERKPKDFQFDPIDIPRKDNSIEFREKIPSYINRFLYSRPLNRLSMPSDLLSKMIGEEKDTLQAWVNSNLTNSETDKRIQACIGEYDLYYIKPDLNSNAKPGFKAVCDSIIIHPSTESLPPTMSETHATLKHNSTKWSGQVHRSNQTLEITLTNDNTIGTFEPKKSIKTISLMINLPKDKDVIAFEESLKKTNYLKGILLGLSDESDFPVAYKFCLIKKDLFEAKDANIMRLVEEDLRSGNTCITIE